MYGIKISRKGAKPQRKKNSFSVQENNFKTQGCFLLSLAPLREPSSYTAYLKNYKKRF